MRIQEIKSRLTELFKNVLVYKKDDSDPLLQQATDKLKAVMSDESSTSSEIDGAYENFDLISARWFDASNTIDEYTENLFNEFAVFKDKEVKLNYKKLWKVLDLLPSVEAKHALVLAVKYYALGEKTKAYFNYVLDDIDDMTLENIAKRDPESKINPKFSLRRHLQKKEELTLEELYKLSKIVDSKTLMPVKN